MSVLWAHSDLLKLRYLLSKVVPKPQRGRPASTDLRLHSRHSDSSLHCQVTNTELVYHTERHMFGVLKGLVSGTGLKF